MMAFSLRQLAVLLNRMYSRTCAEVLFLILWRSCLMRKNCESQRLRHALSDVHLGTAARVWMKVKLAVHFPADWLLHFAVVISKLCYIRSLFLFESKGTLHHMLCIADFAPSFALHRWFKICHSSEKRFKWRQLLQLGVPKMRSKLSLEIFVTHNVANLKDCSPNLGLTTSVCHTFTAFTWHAAPTGFQTFVELWSVIFCLKDMCRCKIWHCDRYFWWQ